jgi:predicted nucleic acid-binding protein
VIVLDASAVLELLLRTAAGEEVERRIAGEALAVPHLLDVEVAQVLRRYARAGAVSDSRTSLSPKRSRLA